MSVRHCEHVDTLRPAGLPRLTWPDLLPSRTPGKLRDSVESIPFVLAVVLNVKRTISLCIAWNREVGDFEFRHRPYAYIGGFKK